MARSILFTCLLFACADVLAQPEARLYYNRFEWIGISAGHGVKNWRFELNGSFHGQDLIGPLTTGHPDYSIDGFTPYPVFDEDVWKEKTTAVTGRILVAGKKARPRFGLYYGIYLRYSSRKSELTEPKWSAVEKDYVSRYVIITSRKYYEICGGVIVGARGTIWGNVFWDASFSLLPILSGERKWQFSDGYLDINKYSGATYLTADSDHLFQVGIGYRFSMKKSGV